jgi:hypothetical protein
VYKKLHDLDCKSQIDDVETVHNNDAFPQLVWLDDESSDPENFILVESRKKGGIRKKILRSPQLIRE